MKYQCNIIIQSNIVVCKIYIDIHVMHENKQYEYTLLYDDFNMIFIKKAKFIKQLI